jgi:hypothetical protein
MLGWLGGCSSHEVGAPQTFTVPSTAAACAELLLAAEYACPTLASSTSATPTTGRREVFVELILLSGPPATVGAARLADVSRLANDPNIQLLAAPHVVTGLGQRHEQTLIDRIGVSHEASLHRISVLPSDVSDGTLALELGVTMQLANAGGVVPAPTATATLTLAGGEQRLLLGSAALPHQQDRALLALVKYWRIRGSEDLRRIFECKMRQRQHALSKR